MWHPGVFRSARQGRAMSFFPCLVRSSTAGGEARFELGDPLVDSLLGVRRGRARPNTVRAVAHRSEDVLHRRRRGPGRGDRRGRVRVPRRSARRPHGGADQRRRVGVVGAHDRAPVVVGVGVLRLPGRPRRHAACESNPVPRGLSTRRRGGRSSAGAAGAGAAHVAEDPRAGRGRRAARRVAHRPGPGDGPGDAARRAAPLRGPRAAARRSPRRRSGRVFIADGKGGHQRVVPISNTFFTAVGDYLHDERPADATTDRVFVALKGPTRGEPLSARGSTRSWPAPAAGPGSSGRRVTSCATPV